MLLFLSAIACQAATFWVHDPAEATEVAHALEELWPAEHEVRVGEGDGFALSAVQLRWTKDGETKQAPVGSLRAGVALARSWEQAPEQSSTPWIPRRDRSWPSGAHPVVTEVTQPPPESSVSEGTWWLGLGVPLGRGLGVSLQIRRDARVSFRAGVASTAVGWVSHDFREVEMFTGEVIHRAYAQRWLEPYAEAGVDLGPQAFLLEPGLRVAAAISSGRQGSWSSVSPTLDVGVVSGTVLLALHAEHALVSATRGRLEDYEQPGTQLGIEIRRRAPIGWDLEGGVRVMGDAGAGAYGMLAITVDLGTT